MRRGTIVALVAGLSARVMALAPVPPSSEWGLVQPRPLAWPLASSPQAFWLASLLRARTLA
jgi:hypothetical protein